MNLLKQTPDKPLFPDFQWDLPERHDKKGNLLLVGGNKHSFIDTQNIFQSIDKSDVRDLRLVLPRSLKKIIGEHEEIEYLSETSAGSISKDSMDDINTLVSWSDGILLSGEHGSNAETTIVIEHLASIDKPTLLSKDSVELLLATGYGFNNEMATYLVDMQQLQKIGLQLKLDFAFKQSEPLNVFEISFRRFLDQDRGTWIIDREEGLIIGNNDDIALLDKPENFYEFMSKAAIYRMQQPQKPFEAVVSAAHEATEYK